MLGALKLLGVSELEDMIDKDGGAEATCEFCKEVYNADANDLQRLIDDLAQSSSAR